MLNLTGFSGSSEWNREQAQIAEYLIDMSDPEDDYIVETARSSTINKV